MHLYVARLHLRITHLGGPRLDGAGNFNDCFLSEGGGLRDELRGSPPGIEGDLNEAGAVAEIDEDETAEIPHAVDPAAERYLLPCVGSAKLTAKVSAL